MLGPAGPKLSASQLHRWVWQVAAPLWDNGHEREAVQSAATSVELELRSKLGVTTGDGRHLVNAFRVEGASATLPRLRLAVYEVGSDDFKSAHEGAASFGAGCFLAIRNITTHRLEVDHALEMLASLSLLAHWIDSAEVQAHP